MKKLIFILFALISVASFGQRVLTDDERLSLVASDDFKLKCQMAVRNYASYWSQHDGSGLGTEALRIKWAKDRLIAVGYITNPAVADPDIALKYVVYSKGATFTLGTAPQPAATIITAWVNAGKFDEFTSIYYDVLGGGYKMSITGN